MNCRPLVLLIIFSVFYSCSQSPSQDLMYIDKVKPTDTPRLFAPEFISKDSMSEFGSVFNSLGTEFFFAVDSAGKSFIKYTYIKEGKWLSPQTIISQPDYGFNDPFLSNDEDRLYYISDMPKSDLDTTPDIDIWYSQRLSNKWSEPINAGSKINSNRNEYYISFTNDGSMYFSSNKAAQETRLHDFDIYKSNSFDGTFDTPMKLPDAINSKRYEADVFIAPDESYIIFCSARKTGLGKGDLYISFKDKSDNWTTAISMGEKINTVEHELCPFVTKDNKYFFYTSNQDIYWVSASIIETLRENLVE